MINTKIQELEQLKQDLETQTLSLRSELAEKEKEVSELKRQITELDFMQRPEYRELQELYIARKWVTKLAIEGEEDNGEDN